MCELCSRVVIDVVLQFFSGEAELVKFIAIVHCLCVVVTDDLAFACHIFCFG